MELDHLTDNTPLILAAIVALADTLIDENRKEQAANLLAFVIAQPHTRSATRQHALDLFDLLESEICPRVIWDARERAQTATLTDIVQSLRDGDDA